MKKSKLILSLAMMCLSIAVLCFGVLAATSVSYSISGSISYDITDVFANINTKVFKVAGQTTSTNMQTNVDALATTALSSIDSTSTTSDSTVTYIDTKQSIEVYNTESEETTTRSFDITLDSTYMTYYIVINIENLADKAVNALLTDSTTYTNLNTATKLTQSGIAKGDTKNLVVAFSIADSTTSTTVTMSYSVAVSYTSFSTITFTIGGTEYTCPEGITFEQFIEGGYLSGWSFVEGHYYITNGYSSGYLYLEDGSTEVKKSDVMLSGTNYKWNGHTGGGSK